MYEFLLMIKYALLQSIGFFILAIAIIAFIFIILYTVSKSLIWQEKSRFLLSFWLWEFFCCFFASNFS